MAHASDSSDTGTETSVPKAVDADAPPRSPFPRYERISEDLADGPTGRPNPPAEEIPRTENWGELWSRASRRGLRR